MMRVSSSKRLISLWKVQERKKSPLRETIISLNFPHRLEHQTSEAPIHVIEHLKAGVVREEGSPWLKNLQDPVRTECKTSIWRALLETTRTNLTSKNKRMIMRLEQIRMSRRYWEI
jgi:hypothetical protein